MNLLQAFCSTYFEFVNQVTFKECEGFLLALPVNAGIAIKKPIQKRHCSVVGKAFG